MSGPIQIRKAAAVGRVRQLARLTGEPLTAAVDEAVAERLNRLDAAKEDERLRWIADIRRIVDEFQALPVVGPWLTDEDLYDKDGMPK